jgi:hypothetical protein
MWIRAYRRLGFLIIRGDIAIHQQYPNGYQDQTTSNRQNRIAFHASPIPNLEFYLFKNLSTLRENTGGAVFMLSRTHCRAASVLIDARRALPIEHIYQVPSVLIEFDLKLALLVDSKLAGWIQYARALALVRVVQIELTAGEIEGR